MSDNFFHQIVENARPEINKMMQEAKKDWLLNEFADFDIGSLHSMSDKELAAWQAKYPPDSAQHIIASQEWDRRSLKKQIGWTKLSIFVGAIATIAAALLGAWTGVRWQKSHQENQSPPSISQVNKTPSVNTAVHPITKGIEKTSSSLPPKGISNATKQP